jgi:Putative adhesin
VVFGGRKSPAEETEGLHMKTMMGLRGAWGSRNFAMAGIWSAVILALVALVSGAPARAQNEKRTVFAENDFHWQGNLKTGQTLEIVNQNGDIEASGASGDAAQVEGTKHDGDENELYIEVVEYSDGVTICAVYAKDKTPGRCHRGGVSSESRNWNWHGHRAKINFSVQVPKGVRLTAATTNGSVRGHELSSVVKAATTNGNVEVATSEWASASTTNGGVRVSMGNAKWTGELSLTTTNGSVHVTLPAGSEFEVRASTTNGGIHTDFPITVQGSFNSKDLSGTVGAGGRELKVATTNGGIELKKG